MKTPCIKNSEYKSQAKKKDRDCNFYNFSLLAPYPNKFLVVCICILIFHGIYSPFPQILFVGDYIFCVLLLGPGKMSNLLGSLYSLGDLISFLGEGDRLFSSIKPSMTNHVISRIVDGKIMCFMCAC